MPLLSFIVPEPPKNKPTRFRRLVQHARPSKFAVVIAVILFASAGTAAAATHPDGVGKLGSGWNRAMADAAHVGGDIAATLIYARNGTLAPLNSLSEVAASILRGEQHQLDVVSPQLANELRNDEVVAVSTLADAAQPFLVQVADYSLVSITHGVGPGPGHLALALASRQAQNSPVPAVLGASTTTAPIKPQSASASYIQNSIQQTFQKLLTQGVLTGPRGPQGPQGPAGNSGVVSNGNGQTTAVISGTPIVTYLPPAPNFNGASIAGFTDLSSANLMAPTANIQGALTVSGNATISGGETVSGSFTAAISTLSTLTVSGPATFSGSTTIAGLTVTGLNPGLTLGSVAFQGASGLSQDNSNFFYDSINHRLALGTTTPSQLLSIAGNLRLTGVLFDSNNASGTLGMLLQSTGSGQQWVATSTLGISGGSGVAGGIVGKVAVFTSSTTLSTGDLLDNLTLSGVNATSSTVNFNIQGTGSLNPLNVASSSGTSILIVTSSGNVGIGTSSPQRTLDVAGTVRAVMQDNGGQVFNVQAYGWLPDGTDHSVQALALLTAVSNAGGGTIYFPPSTGTYRADSEIIIPHSAGSPSSAR